MKFLSVFALVALVASSQVYGVSISIIDSGVDYKHAGLRGKMWTNAVDKLGNYRDEDRNGYLNDYYGWNFAAKNNAVIDYKLLETYNADVFKFFDIQERKMLGTITAADKAWVQSKQTDKKFMRNLSTFANFVHGTHVAGIAAAIPKQPKVQAIKLLASPAAKIMNRIVQTGIFFDYYEEEEDFSLMRSDNGGKKPITETKRWKFVQAVMGKLVSEMALTYDELGEYIGFHKINIANGSFGTPFSNMMRIVQGALKTVGLKPTQEEVVMGTAYMLNLLTQRGRTLVDQAPNTLFVFAAGNEGLDNDKFPTFPTNIVGDNVLSVAATFEFAKLASFSNYGAKMVDVAAPGVLINSYIPGDKRMKVSGTSQASPYVAGVAAAVKEANPRLRPKEIKAIIMGTVDVKDFLKGKVRTGGIVNRNRALYAAALSRSVSVRSAIIGSRSKVADVRSRLSRRSLMRLRALPVQLSPVIY